MNQRTREQKQADAAKMETIRKRYLDGGDGFQAMFDLEDLGVSRVMATMLLRMWRDDQQQAEV